MGNQDMFRRRSKISRLDFRQRVKFQKRFLDCALHNGIESSINHRNTERQSYLRIKDHEDIWDMLDLN